MILRKSREFTVNMGNYESVKLGASVEIDTAKFEVNKEFNPTEFMDAQLETILAQDLEEAGKLTHTRDSFILSWNRE